jgi:GxxExxY protein
MKEYNITYLNIITEKIIGCAIEVHRHLGPGLLEILYERALRYEFDKNKLKYYNQNTLPVYYKGNRIGFYRIDFLVENEIVVEIKAVDKYNPLFEAQLLSYLRLSDKKLGLLINFNVPILKNGIKRRILVQEAQRMTGVSE